LAEPAGRFRVGFQQQSGRLPDGSVYDGNGIENFDWSPRGKRLLIKVSQWTWGTDGTWNTKYILLNGDTGEVRELPISAAIHKHFAKPCAWLVNSQRWLDDDRIEIELKADVELYEEGNAGATPSCIEKLTRFSFDLDPGDLLNWR
jgi:hypothetical protein